MTNDFVQFIELKVKEGTAMGFFLKGFILQYGIGVQRNIEEAIESFKLAASKGNINAAAWIAGIITNKNYVNKENYQEAINYLESAMKQEKVDPYVFLMRAIMLLQGTWEEKNIEEAKKHFKKAIELGETSAMILFSNLLISEQTPEELENNPEKFKEIMAHYEKSAQLGNPNAMYIFGKYQYNTKEFDEASKWLHHAAFYEHKEAMTLLGTMYLENQINPQDHLFARNLFKQAAAMDDRVAIRYLGYIYEYGLGIPKDLNKAVTYYKEAADMNDYNSFPRLANLYVELGSQEEKILAARLFHRAIEEGYADCLPVLEDPSQSYPNVSFTDNDKKIYYYHYLIANKEINMAASLVIANPDLLMKEFVNDSVRNKNNFSNLFKFSDPLHLIHDAKKKAHCHYLMLKELQYEIKQAGSFEKELLELQTKNLNELDIKKLSEVELVELIKNIIETTESISNNDDTAESINFKKYSIQFLMQAVCYLKSINKEKILFDELNNIASIIGKHTEKESYETPSFTENNDLFHHVIKLITNNKEEASIEKLFLSNSGFFKQKTLSEAAKNPVELPETNYSTYNMS